jgi:surface protein
MIKAKDKEHLKQLIQEEIKSHGNRCSLNHIDVSAVQDMSKLFLDSAFCGGISEWDTSNVWDMSNMFRRSAFNGDISQWKTSSVIDMGAMFAGSKFDGNISQWDVSNVIIMEKMFYGANFNQSVEKWTLSKKDKVQIRQMFEHSTFEGNLSHMGLTEETLRSMFGKSYEEWSMKMERKALLSLNETDLRRCTKRKTL